MALSNLTSEHYTELLDMPSSPGVACVPLRRQMTTTESYKAPQGLSEQFCLGHLSCSSTDRIQYAFYLERRPSTCLDLRRRR